MTKGKMLQGLFSINIYSNLLFSSLIVLSWDVVICADGQWWLGRSLIIGMGM
jgi:hypothetical protein